MKRHYRKETRYVSVISVHVPDVAGLIDMLRYDRCCPASEDESRKLWALLGDDAGRTNPKPEDHIVRLLRYAANPDHPTIDRWRSFECTVLDERSPDDPPATDEELANNLKLILAAKDHLRSTK